MKQREDIFPKNYGYIINHPLPCKWWWRISISFFWVYNFMQKVLLLTLDGCYVVCAFSSRSQKPLCRSNLGEKGFGQRRIMLLLAKSLGYLMLLCTAEELVPVFVVHLDPEYGFSPHDYQLLLHRILSRTWHNVKCFASARLSNWLENLTPS